MKKRIKYYIPVLTSSLFIVVHYFVFRNRGVCQIYNSGFAFGVGESLSSGFKAVVFLLSLIYLCILLFKSRDSWIKGITVSVILLSVSNFMERTFTLGICDYINISMLNFPLFNLLDLGIVIGIVYLLVYMLKDLLSN